MAIYAYRDGKMTVVMAHGAGTVLTVAEIDERLAQMWEIVATYREGGEVPVSPLIALEIVDELLDLRCELAAVDGWQAAA